MSSVPSAVGFRASGDDLVAQELLADADDLTGLQLLLAGHLHEHAVEAVRDRGPRLCWPRMSSIAWMGDR